MRTPSLPLRCVNLHFLPPHPRCVRAVVGEIIPQAVCTGPHRLAITGYSAPVVRVLVLAFWVVAKPISWVMDRTLGEEQISKYRRVELKEFIKSHGPDTPVPDTAASGNDGDSDDGKTRASDADHIGHEEVAIIHGALDLRMHLVSDVMTAWEDVYMLPHEVGAVSRWSCECRVLVTYVFVAVAVAANVDAVPAGHAHHGQHHCPRAQQSARVCGAFLCRCCGAAARARHSTPCVLTQNGDRNNCPGYFIVKKIIAFDPDDRRPLTQIMARHPIIMRPGQNLLAALRKFLKKSAHIAFVCNDPKALRAAYAVRCLRACTRRGFAGPHTHTSLLFLQKSTQDGAAFVVPEGVTMMGLITMCVGAVYFFGAAVVCLLALFSCIDTCPFPCPQ